MKAAEIISNITARLNIAELNEMQTLMSTTDQQNLLLIAPTGSGKTIAFALRLLRCLTHADATVQAVVLAPSRELVLQIAEVVRQLAAGFKTVSLYGGHPMLIEKNSLQHTPDIIVATPGRLLDHLQRRHLDLSTVRSLVIDEYDKMLELGFQDEMQRLIAAMPSLRLRVLTSATTLDELPPFIGPLSHYKIFDFSGKGNSPRTSTAVVEVPSVADDKLDTLIDLLNSLDNQKVIIFVNHRESAERVFAALQKKRLPVGLYHGGLDQMKRRLAVDLLENGTTPILVATDIAARGLDITDIGSVIHYHLPVNEETWTHRNGRTARMGASGTVYVIVSDRDSIPPFIRFDRTYRPTGHSDNPIHATFVTLYFDLGKRDKISRGDIAGFLIHKGLLDKDDIGKIDIADTYAIAAVLRTKATQALEAVRPHRLKNKRVRVSLLHTP